MELFAKAELIQADLKMVSVIKFCPTFTLFEDGLPYLETHLDVEGTEDEGGKESVVR